ncbi:MAG: AAA family ATPase [Eubacteriales bacterium]
MGTIITIARQFGSGGHEVGRKLAEMLGVKCYDRDLITLAAQKSGMSEEALGHVDEKAASSLLYTLVMGSNIYHSNVDQFNVPINDRLFCIQSEIIREIAAKESCVIVGRCADYVLTEHPRCVRVFVYSGFDARVKTVCERSSVSEGEARDMIIKNDKRRSNYYNYYTGHKWGRLENYDLSLSTEKLGVEKTARLIADYASAAYPD